MKSNDPFQQPFLLPDRLLSARSSLSDYDENDKKELHLLVSSTGDASNCDLSGADLTGMELLGLRFDGSNLKGTNLSSAILSGSSFRNCDLSGCDLSSSNFTCARCASIGRTLPVKLKNVKHDEALKELMSRFSL